MSQLQQGCVDAIGSRRYISCVLNAENGNEATVSIRPGEGTKTVVVLGGGIAGLEAAHVAAVRGYHVYLYERSDKLGGQIHLASMPPRKEEILRSIQYYEKVLQRLDVAIYRNSTCSVDAMNATGAQNIMLPIPGADRDNVVSAWEVLNGSRQLRGTCAVIGGGLVAMDTVQNREVTIPCDYVVMAVGSKRACPI